MGLSIYEMPPDADRADEYRRFLESCGLRDEEDADLVAWMDDGEGRLVACGALAGHTIKQLAVSPYAEGQGLMASVVSLLISEAAARGVFRLFLCTKPVNKSMFSSLGFYEVVATEDAVLMENRKGGADSFIESIAEQEEEWEAEAAEMRSGEPGKSGSVCGAVVCNCDPFTLGHRRLIEYAAANSSKLFVFAVSENGSMFSPEERLEMIRRGTADIKNCRVYASDLYLISRATFPAYFIKDEARAEEVKADLDIEFFAGRLAPALGITKRFVGEEPLDPVTRAYNERMKELLPARGIDVEEIPRLTEAWDADRSAEDTGTLKEDCRIISASRVRSLIGKAREAAAANDSGGREEILEQIKNMVPETTYEAVLRHV